MNRTRTVGIDSGLETEAAIYKRAKEKEFELRLLSMVVQYEII